MITVITFIVWLIVGGCSLVLRENISKLSYFLCWFMLMIYIIAVGSLAGI